MWKLFFKNKMIEIANWFYNHRITFMVLAILVGFISLFTWFIIFLDSVSPRTQLIIFGILITTVIAIPFVRWLMRNYEMAKKGISVTPAWINEQPPCKLFTLSDIDNKMYEANEETFEELWMDDNMSNCSPKSRRSVSDDLYIEYVKWERDNAERMDKKHRPDVGVIRGTHPNLIFHGGCIGCVTQLKRSVEVCKRCSYFRNDSRLPSQFTEE